MAPESRDPIQAGGSVVGPTGPQDGEARGGRRGDGSFYTEISSLCPLQTWCLGEKPSERPGINPSFWLQERTFPLTQRT